jgi:hypothetical protein
MCTPGHRPDRRSSATWGRGDGGRPSSTWGERSLEGELSRDLSGPTLEHPYADVPVSDFTRRLMQQSNADYRPRSPSPVRSRPASSRPASSLSGPIPYPHGAGRAWSCELPKNKIINVSLNKMAAEGTGQTHQQPTQYPCKP